MGKIIDIAGEKYGRLTVLEMVEGHQRKGVSTKWKCKCDCGNLTVTTSNRLRTGTTKSCGCIHKEILSKGNGNLSHGQSRKGHETTEWKMWKSAHQRARIKGLDFNIELQDIFIPQYCPIFTNIKLNRGNKSQQDDSPSLDRTNNSLGYVKGNIVVMSHRANRIKSDATAEELSCIATWINKNRSYR